MRVLCAAGVFGGLAQSLAGAAGTLLARRLGGSDAAAGLPQALLVVGAVGAAAVLSRVQARRGRRPGLVAGGVVAVAGCGLGVLAARSGSLAVLGAASVLLGWGNCAVMYARYAAADTGDPRAGARALAAVLTAISVGAVVGPNLLAVTAWFDGIVALPTGSGAYVVSGLAFAAASAVWLAGLRRGPAARPVRARPARLSPRSPAAAAIGVLAVANLVMVATMTMAPVQLQQRDGSGLGAIGLVVSAHIAAMFAPAPLSGRLVDRFGERSSVLVACVVSVAATGVAAFAGGSACALAAAMVLLGLGWNLATVAASALLTRVVPRADRARREGSGEIGMGVAAAVGGGLSGVVMAGGGYPVLAAGGLAVVLAGLVPLGLRLPGRRRG